MLPERATVVSRELDDTVGVLDIQGEITGAAEKPLMDGYCQLSQRGKVNILLNFAAMDYMNSSGIGLLVTLFIRASREGYRLGAVALRPHFKRIFGLTRLQDIMPIFDTEAEAVEHFKIV